MPLQATSGAASYDAFGGGAVVRNYIEDVFSTYLYTGTGSTQTITNDIDLSTKGGLTWIKSRSGTTGHRLTDTARGATKSLVSETTAAEVTESTGLTSFGTTGFTIGADADYNTSAATYVSWSFRKQPKYFDIVTYTGDGTSQRPISHSLGSTPGCIIVKQTNTTRAWPVFHRSLTGAGELANLFLNTAGSEAENSYFPTVSETIFQVSASSAVNESGGSYVAYLFAHDAGGFGLTGADNVISCASYTGNGSNTGPIINLGYEPQWIMIKNANGASNEDWYIVDNARALTSFDNPTNNTAFLRPNSTAVETASSRVKILSTGFQITVNSAAFNESGKNFIYVAIRRGPMKVPTDATKVFGLSARTGTGANATVTGGQTDDVVLIKNRGSAVASLFSSRVTGPAYLVTSSTAAEVSAGTTILQANPWDVMDGVMVGTTSTITNASSNTYINYLFKRAPSFMDVSTWVGDGNAGRTVTHNLTVVPEMIIVKQRNGANSFRTYVASLGNTNSVILNSSNGVGTDASWNNTTPTSSVFSVGSAAPVNASAFNYIAYLFATCANVSKVGSYTGNGTTQTIDCGLTAGARFVLIKRTDSTGDWYVYDTARGMTLLTDPYWFTNSTAAEVATLGSVTTVATGFAVDSTILAAINVNAGTYIFLAIA
jgi:hypothetical protein